MVLGPRGLRLPLSRASKQQLGCRVVWLGACLAAGLGLVWLPREKAVHAAAALDTALRGEMAVSEYRRVLGFLVSLLFMMGGNKGLLHHIFRPVRPGEEIDSGPATLVFVDECMRPGVPSTSTTDDPSTQGKIWLMCVSSLESRKHGAPSEASSSSTK